MYSSSLSPSIHTDAPYEPFILNDHTMTTRDKSGIYKPKAFIVHTKPTTYRQTLVHPKWFSAM